MAPGNVWLDGRRREAGALGAIITALESAAEAPQAAAGAGTAARADAAITRQDERNAR
jgi:hypothetical protein